MSTSSYLRAAFLGMNDEIKKYVSKNPGNINAQNDEGESALHCSASGDNPQTTKLLLALGVNPNLRNIHGETAIHYAVVNDLFQTVRYLSHYGGDILIRSAKGYKPIDLARSKVMKDMLDEMEYNMEIRYQKLLELISSPAIQFSLPLVLCDTVNKTEGLPRKDKDVLAKKLVKIFEAKSACLTICHALIGIEVNATVQEHTLFRTDSMATKIMGNYAKLIGLEYLHRSIGDLIRSALEGNPARFEVDPSKAGSEEKSQQNLVNLKEICQKFLTSIIASMSYCPLAIKVMCKSLITIVEKKFPASSTQAISGFLFLRFFNAAVSNPNMFGITKMSDDEMSMEVRRPLILIAKVLQNLANNVEFGDKETYMKPMNEFITVNQKPMMDWIECFRTAVTEDISSIERRYVPEFTKDDITAADMIFIHTLCVKVGDGIMKRLDASAEEVEQLTRIQSSFHLVKPVRNNPDVPNTEKAIPCTKKNCACIGMEEHYWMPMYCLNCDHLVGDHKSDEESRRGREQSNKNLNMYSHSTRDLLKSVDGTTIRLMREENKLEETLEDPTLTRPILASLFLQAISDLDLPPQEEWKSYF
eukprot:c34302_g1_i1.p1 GENE.c34302_g1_i1~~c34302_g1_i1.p1  ORF type:complete len:588 (-),score=-33.45 c34302_g1_i1:12-1775(-)